MSFRVGDRVRVTSQKVEPELQGCMGTITSAAIRSGLRLAWDVDLDDHPQGDHYFYIDEIELLEEKSSNFQIGDKVKIVTAAKGAHCNGWTGTLNAIDLPDGVVIVACDNGLATCRSDEIRHLTYADSTYLKVGDRVRIAGPDKTQYCAGWTGTIIGFYRQPYSPEVEVKCDNGRAIGVLMYELLLLQDPESWQWNDLADEQDDADLNKLLDNLTEAIHRQTDIENSLNEARNDTADARKAIISFMDQIVKS